MLPAPAREGLSGLGAPQFTTDIFSAKSRVCICKHFVNKLPPPAVRRCNSFCFYGIAAAIGLRHTNGNIGVTISNIRPECFSFSLPLLQFQKRFLASFQKIVLQGKKRTVCIANRSEKTHTSFLFQIIPTKECRPCPTFGDVRSSQLVQ